MMTSSFSSIVWLEFFAIVLFKDFFEVFYDPVYTVDVHANNFPYLVLG